MIGELSIPGLDVSRETEAKLHSFVNLVEKWTSRINLIGPATQPEIWDRHIRDSAQLVPLAPISPTHWVDLGSGGGFPGIVVAIIAAELWPAMQVTLVESDQRKSAFLRTAVRELGVPAQVVSRRIESLEPLGADVVTARALAPLDALLGYIAPHLTPEGRALLPKGRQATAEIARARQSWRFGLAIHPSLTDQEASILVIDGIEHG